MTATDTTPAKAGRLKFRPLPSREYLAACFALHGYSGTLTWRERPASHFEGRKYPAERVAAQWNRKFAGRPAGCPRKCDGRWVVEIGDVAFLRSRVIYVLAGMGPDPGELRIDHWSGDETDDRPSNLRPATQAQNLRNAGLRTSNTSGYPGVSWHKARDKWRARIKVDGREKHLGVFDLKTDAIARRRAAELEFFGEFSATFSRSDPADLANLFTTDAQLRAGAAFPRIRHAPVSIAPRPQKERK